MHSEVSAIISYLLVEHMPHGTDTDSGIRKAGQRAERRRIRRAAITLSNFFRRAARKRIQLPRLLECNAVQCLRS